MDIRIRNNGLQSPLDILQVVSIIVFFIIIIFFTLFTIPHLDIKEIIISLIITFILHLLVSIYWYKSVITDPNDQIECTSGTYCVICSKHTKERSHHCNTCNRCIYIFDHHCKILNNCIGEQNYSYFLTLLVFSILDNATLLTLSVVCITRLSLAGSNNRLFDISPKVQLIINLLIGIVLFILFFVLFSFFLFHAYLKCKGLTTYEYMFLGHEGNSTGNINENENREKVAENTKIIPS